MERPTSMMISWPGFWRLLWDWFFSLGSKGECVDLLFFLGFTLLSSISDSPSFLMPIPKLSDLSAHGFSVSTPEYDIGVRLPSSMVLSPHGVSEQGMHVFVSLSSSMLVTSSPDGSVGNRNGSVGNWKWNWNPFVPLERPVLVSKCWAIVLVEISELVHAMSSSLLLMEVDAEKYCVSS